MFEERVRPFWRLGLGGGISSTLLAHCHQCHGATRHKVALTPSVGAGDYRARWWRRGAQLPWKEHGENYSSQLAAPVVSTTSPLLLKCILHAQRQAEMVLPWSNIHNLVKIVPHLVVRSGGVLLHTLDSVFHGQDSLGSS